MKKILSVVLAITMIAVMMVTFTGCSEAERVSYNLSQQADNFNVVRQLTVINCIEGDVLFSDVRQDVYYGRYGRQPA